MWFWLTTNGLVRTMRDRVVLEILAIASLVIAIAVVVGMLPVLVGIYGKNLTFSGRTEIWSASLNAAVTAAGRFSGFAVVM